MDFAGGDESNPRTEMCLVYPELSDSGNFLLFSRSVVYNSLDSVNCSCSLVFFGTVHSDGTIFPFLVWFLLLFFSQLFVRPPQIAILLLCISFPWDGLDPCLLYNVTNLQP